MITNSQTRSFNLGDIVWIFDPIESQPHPAIILDFIREDEDETKSEKNAHDTRATLMGFQKYLISFKGRVIEDYDYRFHKTYESCDNIRYV